ncbi:MAG: DUF192 domain-containing protein [Chloroflexota bacterium]
MRVLNIKNISRSLPQPIQARYCDSFLCRLKGLTFRRSLDPQEGLLLVQPRENRLDAAIHMLFVPIDLTVVWVNEARVIVDLKLARRWRPFYIPAQPAKYILEVADSWLPSFQVGDQLDFEEAHLA